MTLPVELFTPETEPLPRPPWVSRHAVLAVILAGGRMGLRRPGGC